MHIQIRLIGNFGLDCGVPWFPLSICKQDTENVTHFLLVCPFFKENVESVWLNIKVRITETNPVDDTQVSNFISNLARDSMALLLLLLRGGGGTAI